MNKKWKNIHEGEIISPLFSSLLSPAPHVFFAIYLFVALHFSVYGENMNYEYHMSKFQ